MASSPLTSIPVHQDVVRRLRSMKSSDQTWDEFLLEIADDYVPRSWVLELERRARNSKEGGIPGELVLRESRAKANRRR